MCINYKLMTVKSLSFSVLFVVLPFTRLMLDVRSVRANIVSLSLSKESQFLAKLIARKSEMRGNERRRALTAN